LVNTAAKVHRSKYRLMDSESISNFTAYWCKLWKSCKLSRRSTSCNWQRYGSLFVWQRPRIHVFLIHWVFNFRGIKLIVFFFIVLCKICLYFFPVRLIVWIRILFTTFLCSHNYFHLPCQVFVSSSNLTATAQKWIQDF
jgi:hypothetical protein